MSLKNWESGEARSCTAAAVLVAVTARAAITGETGDPFVVAEGVEATVPGVEGHRFDLVRHEGTAVDGPGFRRRPWVEHKLHQLPAGSQQEVQRQKEDHHSC